jgi:tetratricopeptide (TPR) repeat protein
VIEVRISTAAVWPGVKQPDELAGLFTALIETGLADLVDVAPYVEATGPSPGLEQRLLTDVEIWTGKLGIVAEGEELRYGLLLCDPTGACENLEAIGSREVPSAPAAGLLAQATTVLGREPIADAAARWGERQSSDTYALLMVGRSAAIFYGLRPPVAESIRWDERRDPVARASYIDPSMPIAWWIQGRLQLDVGAARLARESFTRASLTRPASVLFKADEATALAAQERWDDAWRAWEEVNARTADDPRFAVPRAKAALESGRVKEALGVLDRLPKVYQDERAVAELRVAIAEATGGSSNYDELLARWQAAAPNDPEPVRRRIAIRVDDGRLQEALELAGELERRGEPEEATRLGMALAIGLGDHETAALRADRLGRQDVAGRIRARADLEAGAKGVPAEIADAADPIGLVVAGEALLSGGSADLALAKAEAALKLDAWMPEALDLQARSLDQLGRGDEAAKARSKARSADPDFGA